MNRSIFLSFLLILFIPFKKEAVFQNFRIPLREVCLER